MWPGTTWHMSIGSQPLLLSPQSYRQVNTPKQNLHCLQHCNPVSLCQSLGDLAIQIYQQLIGTAEKKLKPMIGMFCVPCGDRT